MGNILKIDTVNIRYKELFTVKFFHSGYGLPRNNFIAEAIGISPDEETKKTFSNHNIGYQFLSDTLVCFIQTKFVSPPSFEPKVPFIKFSASEVLRFCITVSNEFLNVTNVEAAGAQQLYQFGNKVNVETDHFICMHTEGVNNDDLKNTSTVKADKTCFGVIDITNTGAVNSSYEIFDTINNQQLKSPAYNIRFKSKI
jgi:hypothetical protein